MAVVRDPFVEMLASREQDESEQKTILPWHPHPHCHQQHLVLLHRLYCQHPVARSVLEHLITRLRNGELRFQEMLTPALSEWLCVLRQPFF